MKLKLKVATLDEVPEALRTQYEQKDGAFELKQEFEIADPPDVTGLTNKRDELLRSNAELKRQYEGIDPVKAREALQKVGELENKDKGNVDRLTQIEQRLEVSEKAREKAEAETAAERVRSAGSTAISTAKPKPEALVLLMPIIERRSKVVDGVTQIFLDDGKTPAIDKAGAPLTMDGLVGELKTAYPSVFEPTGAGGGGAPANSSGGGQNLPQVSITDSAAMGANLESIASGKTVVTGG